LASGSQPQASIIRCRLLPSHLRLGHGVRHFHHFGNPLQFPAPAQAAEQLEAEFLGARAWCR
jgi:hypothetical protein